MKRLLVFILGTMCVITLVVGYLAVIGMNEGIDSRSTNNVVVFSDAAAAEQAADLSTSFKPFENVEVRLEGMSVHEGNELALRAQMTGHYRRGLFGTAEYFVCTKSEMKERIREHLVSVTGDTGLEIKRLGLGYLEDS